MAAGKPKVLLAAHGTRLYRELYSQEDGPNPKNARFSNYLTLTWECATGEPDIMEWTRAIRVAQSKKWTEAEAVAQVSAFFDADDLLRYMQQIESDRRLREPPTRGA